MRTLRAVLPDGEATVGFQRRWTPPYRAVFCAVVGQAGDAAGLLELVAGERPDLAIVDIRMPPDHSVEGIEAARTIRERHPSVGILVLSAFVEVEDALELLAGGRKVGHLLKSRVTVVDEFIEALDRILRGGSVVDPSLVQELFSAQRSDDPLAHLNAREREVANSASRRTATITAVSWPF
ncbi:Response regulator receiver domain-containing protein [Streptomyces sp. cf386]|nr:Response regulator receiver domain-containing protein [Streptomyces sp. cf386]